MSEASNVVPYRKLADRYCARRRRETTEALSLFVYDAFLSDLLAQTLRSELWAPEFLAELGIGEEQAMQMREIW